MNPKCSLQTSYGYIEQTLSYMGVHKKFSTSHCIQSFKIEISLKKTKVAQFLRNLFIYNAHITH